VTGAASGDDRILTAAEAEAMLPAGPLIHTLTRHPDGDIDGEDWPREKVLALLTAATVIRPAGEQAQAAGHGLAVLSPWRSARQDGPFVTFVETGERRDQLHLALGTYAEHLLGLASAADLQAAAAAVPASQMNDYAAITADIRARHETRDRS
jgi:hypothetical protein